MASFPVRVYNEGTSVIEPWAAMEVYHKYSGTDGNYLAVRRPASSNLSAVLINGPGALGTGATGEVVAEYPRWVKISGTDFAVGSGSSLGVQADWQGMKPGNTGFKAIAFDQEGTKAYVLPFSLSVDQTDLQGSKAGFTLQIYGSGPLYSSWNSYVDTNSAFASHGGIKGNFWVSTSSPNPDVVGALSTRVILSFYGSDPAHCKSTCALQLGDENGTVIAEYKLDDSGSGNAGYQYVEKGSPAAANRTSVWGDYYYAHNAQFWRASDITGRIPTQFRIKLDILDVDPLPPEDLAFYWSAVVASSLQSSNCKILWE